MASPVLLNSQVQKANCIKLPGIAQTISLDMWGLSTAGPLTFTSMILSYQKHLLWHVVGSSPGEVRVNSSLLVTPQLRWDTPPWRQSNGNPGLIATELALCMASILSRSGKLHIFAGAKRSKQHCDTSRGLNAEWFWKDSFWEKDWQLRMLSRKTCGLACHSKNSSASQGHVVSRILTAEQFQDCLNHHVYNANKYLKQCKVVVNQVVWYLHIHHQFSKGGEYAGVQYMTSLHAKVQKCHQCPTNHARMIPLVSQTFAPMVETGQLHRQLSPQPGRLEPKVTLVVELVLAYPSHHKAIKTSPGTSPKHDSLV